MSDDGGLITFDDERCLMVSPVLPHGELATLAIEPGVHLSKWQPGHRELMRVHRNHVFLADPAHEAHE